MNQSIMIASAEIEEEKRVKDIFEQEGCTDIIVVKNNLEMVLQCEKTPVDVLFVDMMIPFLDSVSTLDYIAQNNLAKIIVALGEQWEKNQSLMRLQCIDVFVTRPIESKKIIPGLLVAIAQREKMKQLEVDYEQAETELRNQKIVSYGKQLVMSKLKMSEQDAEQFLQKLAKEHNREVIDVYEVVYTILCNKKNIMK